jgi:beta-lactamase regulating signal transducer with metallopeptidase domain
VPDGGILLALPAQSIAVRLALAALIAIVVVRVLLRADVRNAGVRVAYALLPIGVLLAVVVASLADLRLPTLMVPASDAPSQVVLGLGGDYLYLAPLTLPAIMGAWALVVVTRALLRSVRTARAARAARLLVRDGSAPATLRRRVLVLARRLGITPPAVVLGECPGGAAAIGIRKPVLLLDAEFVASLDDDELDGVIAHELAHVARRDNLVAYLFGLGRDVMFFLPGGSWALRQLLVERELAADQTAISATNRPGALAGGLLKVLEATETREACAALMPTGSLAARVATLCEDQPRPRPLRTSAETLSVVAAFVGLVATSLLVPRWIAGPDPEAGVGVMLATSSRVVDTAPERPVIEPAWDPAALPQALGSYHGTVDSAPAAVGGDLRSPDEQADSLAAGMLRTCAGDSTCRLEPPPASTLQLHPQPTVVQRVFPVRWHAQPVGAVEGGARVRVYYLSSLPD